MKIARSAAAVAAAFVVLLPTSAHADTAVTYDSLGDVAAITYNESTEEETVAPAPDRKQGDIVRVRTSFEGESIRISATFRGLVKAGPFMFHSLRLVTSKLQRNVDIYAGSGFWAGEAQMSKYGNPVACKGLTHKIDYAAKLAVVTVPRACLSASGWKPGAVRVGWGTGTVGSDETIFVDDAFKRGPITGDENLHLSAAVYR